MHGKKGTNHNDRCKTAAGGTHTRVVFGVPPWSTASLGQGQQSCPVQGRKREEELKRIRLMGYSQTTGYKKQAANTKGIRKKCTKHQNQIKNKY
jgi:hypothetical protein